ncbi:tetratricopeptide repeat protein [Flagellimonas olearia]|nr:tetratricopeptide repeat protein [Allomuricauda olearia]
MRKLLIINILSLLLFSCDLTSSGEYFNRARDFEIEGKYEKANALLDKAIAKNPKFRPALLNRAVNKSILEDYEGAIEDYKALLEFDPDNALALLNLGNNYKRIKNYEDAISSYNKALSTEWVIKSVPVGELINDIETSLKLELDQHPSFDKDSEYEVNELDVIYERGIAYVLNEQFSHGINDMEKLLEHEYYIADCHYWIGNAHVGLKDSTNACQSFIKSAKLGLKIAREKIKEHCLKNKN